MSFISKLFGGGSNPKVPTPPPPTPNLGDAVTEAAGRESRARLKKRYGGDDTILAGGLGDSKPTGPRMRSTLG